MYIDWFIILRNITFFFATLMLVKYFIFMVIAPWYNVKETLRRISVIKNKNEGYNPLVSIVVPAWNESKGILKTVASLLRQSYSNIDIIVINDGSDDDTHEVMNDFLANLTASDARKINYIKQKRGGKGVALNRGVESSKGEIVITMDADSVFEKHAIENFVQYFKDPTINAVVGNVKVAENNTLVGLLQKLEYIFGFYFKRTHAVLGAEYIFGGACTAFRKSTTFDAFGLFDTQNKTEDIEMSMRLRAFGIKCTYAENVICYTEGASAAVSLINQRLRWKKGRFDTFIRYRNMFFSGNGKQNKFLTWFVLPYSLLGEFQLLFEPIAISLLVAYSLISGDYFSLMFGSLFMFTIYLVNAIFSSHVKAADRILFIPLFFFTWALFYVLVWVEYLALLKGIVMLLRGNDIEWQNWERKGVGTT